MLKVGVDVDGVLLDFISPLSNLFHSIPRNPDKWDVSEYLKTPVEKKAFEDLLKDPRYMSEKLPAFPDIKEQLIPYLKNHKVYIVSSRKEGVHDATEKRLRGMGMSPVEFRWAKFGHKEGLIQDLDCHIEDLPIYAKNIPIDFPLIMPLRSYNKSFIESQRTIKRKLFPYNRVDELINILEALNDLKEKGVPLNE